ncbi:MAG: hypothetical protein V3T77_09455, partial [Planctomycetota bacterium]
MQKIQLPHDSGLALIPTIFFALVLFGITASMVHLSITHAHAVRESNDQRIAFYLAEGGLSAAKKELAIAEDLARDGIGNVRKNLPMGSYAVTATALGTNLYMLSSTASVAEQEVRLEEVVETVVNTRFPLGAISILGGAKDKRLELRGDMNLILDGGDKPAMVFSDVTIFEHFAGEVAGAVVQSRIPAQNITGRPNSSVIPREGGHPICRAKKFPMMVEEVHDPNFYNDLYASLYRGVQDVLLTAESVGGLSGAGNDLFSFGTRRTPAVIRFTDEVELEDDSEIHGFGTLIISTKCFLRGRSSLSWEGDVIVLADETSPGELSV